MSTSRGVELAVARVRRLAAVGAHFLLVGCARVAPVYRSRKSPGVLWAEQAISLEQALRIFTLDGARALRREAATGSQKVGKSADLIVLRQNLFQIPPEEIAATVVEMTFFGGRRVFQI